MSEVLLFVGVEDKRGAFLVGEGHMSRDQTLVDFNSVDCLGGLVPEEDTDLLDSLVALSEVMLEDTLTLALIEVAFDGFLFHLCDVDPSRVILVVDCFPEATVLHYLLMQFLDEH